MKKSDLLERLLCSTILTAAVFCAAPAMAQEAEADEVDVEMEEETDERMVITGSRLLGSSFDAPNPVLTVNPQDLASRGTVQVEDFLNRLPQVFTGQTSDVSNGASGTATVNLRGLGANRTLPLIDGKRLPYGSPVFSPSNVDLVPTQLVERIDVVTGGASAVYGSDAVAGVVNFILKDDFEGFEVDVQGSFNVDQNDNNLAQIVLAESGQPIPADSTLDGFGAVVSATFGANTRDDKGNVTLFFQYFRQGEQLGGDHDVGACSLGSGGGTGGLGCVGSSNFRRFNTNVGLPLQFQTETGELVPFSGGPDETFNFGSFNFYQRPVERFTIYGKAHYQFLENLRGYLTAEFMNNSSDAQIAPSASFNRPFEINCDNPLLNQGLAADGTGNTYLDILGCEGDEIVPFIHSHRNVEGDPRISIIENSTYRVVGGIDGQLFNDTVTYDLFAQFSRVTLQDVSIGDISFDNAQQALFVVADPTTGEPVCSDPSGGCVPWDIFTRGADGSTGVTPEAAAFIQGVGITTGDVEQVVIGGTLQVNTGDYGFSSPFAKDGASVLGGFEFRSDNLESIPDVVSRTPLGRGLTGVGGATLPVQGEVRVAEAFTEVNIPIIQDVPFIQDFSINGAYRRSMYTVDDLDGNTNSFDTNTFHAGVAWRPIDDIRLRAQFQRAVRAPNVIELFTGQDTGLFDLQAGPNGLGDPCAGDFDPNTPIPEPSASFEQCVNTGVTPFVDDGVATPGEYGTIEDSAAFQFNSITGGNPDLEPESSDTITAGIQITPRWIDNLTVSVDYFNISVTDFINPIPPAVSLSECINTGNAAFCDLIQRDAFGTLFLTNTTADGEVAGITATDVNIAEFNTSGLDFNIQYAFEIGDLGFGDYGTFVFDYAATYLLELEFQSIPGAEFDSCVGVWLNPCTGANSIVGVPTPEYRHFAAFTWETPVDLDIRLNWRYSSSISIAEDAPAVSNSIDGGHRAVQYLDAAFFYRPVDDIALRMGVNNIFDRDPPLTTTPGTGTGNNNTFPGVYDATGRFFFFGVTFTR